MKPIRVQSSRRLEREAARNLEVMWLLGRLVPDHKHMRTCAGTTGLRSACARLDALCRQMGSVTLSKPLTSGAKAEVRFGKRDFVAEEDAYRCPAGELQSQ